jgi:alkylation response protein AidB-like acyl-CoA dehydrogenase
MTTLRHERGTAAMTMALSLEKQLRRFVQYLQQAGLTGHPHIRNQVAEAWIRLQALRFTNYRMLSATANGAEPGPESSIAKLAWSEANQALTAVALSAQGLAGALDHDDAPWHGYWQNQRLRSRGSTIEGGTSEILRTVVAERVLGLPRGR